MSKRLGIPADHPTFSGHFPGRPILPGVVLLDAAIQAIAAELGVEPGPCQIKAAKFLSPVGPDTELEIRHEGSLASVRFEIVAGARQVASGTLVFAGVEAP